MVDAQEITNQMVLMIRELNGNSRSYQNFRMNGSPSRINGCFLWQIFAEPKGQETTHSVSVRFFPEENIFRGCCDCSYELQEIEQVKSRIKERFN